MFVRVRAARELKLTVEQTRCVTVHVTKVMSGGGGASLDVVQNVSDLTRWNKVCLQLASATNVLHLAFVINLLIVVQTDFILLIRTELERSFRLSPPTYLHHILFPALSWCTAVVANRLRCSLQCCSCFL